jgi:copper(I)-binding protein
MMKFSARHLLASIWMATAAGVSVPATACEFYAEGFTLIHPWARPTGYDLRDIPVYFRLADVTQNDRLLRGSTSIAESVELRQSDDMEAPKLDSIEVQPADFVEFSPGHPHVVLRGINIPIQWGRSYPMTLFFEKAGPIAVMISVGAH